MNQRLFAVAVHVLIAGAVLFCGERRLWAESLPAAQSKPTVQSVAVEERKKSAVQRRQEAKKRLLEAIEARKARRLAAPEGGVR